MEPIPYFATDKSATNGSQLQSLSPKKTQPTTVPSPASATAQPPRTHSESPSASKTLGKSDSELASADLLFAKYNSTANNSFNFPNAGQDDFFSTISASAGVGVGYYEGSNVVTAPAGAGHQGKDYNTNMESFPYSASNNLPTSQQAVADPSGEYNTASSSEIYGAGLSHSAGADYYGGQQAVTANAETFSSQQGTEFYAPTASYGYPYQQYDYNSGIQQDPQQSYYTDAPIAIQSNNGINGNQSVQADYSNLQTGVYGYESYPSNVSGGDLIDGNINHTNVGGAYDAFGGSNPADYSSDSYHQQQLQQAPLRQIEAAQNSGIKQSETYLTSVKPGISANFGSYDDGKEAEDNGAAGEFVTKVSPSLPVQQPVPRPANTAAGSGVAERMDAAFAESRPQSGPPAAGSALSTAVSPPPVKPALEKESEFTATTNSLGSVDLLGNNPSAPAVAKTQGFEIAANPNAGRSSTDDDLDELVFASSSQREAQKASVNTTNSLNFATQKSVISPPLPPPGFQTGQQSCDAVSVASHRSQGSLADSAAQFSRTIGSPDSFTSTIARPPSTVGSFSGERMGTAAPNPGPVAIGKQPISTPTADFKYCPSCQKRNDVDANFCSKCGCNMSIGNSTVDLPVEITRTASPAQSNTSFTSAPSKSSAKRSNTFSPPASSSLPQTAYYNPYQQQLPQQQPYAQHYPAAVAPITSSFNDPLGRKGAPVVAFGFGGKLIVMLTQTHNRFVSGANGAVTQTRKTYSGFIQIRSLKPALKTDYPVIADALAKFRGPVANSKKKEIIKWIDDRVQQLQQQNQSAPRQEGPVLLYAFLKLIADSDGKLFQSQSPKMAEIIVKQLLTLESMESLTQLSAVVQPTKTPYEEQRIISEIRQFLIQGEREKALELAVQNSLWAHAMILANGLGKQHFSATVQSFMQTNLSSGDPLALVYSLFSGASCDFTTHDSSAKLYWRENLAALLSNRNESGDPTSFIQLGDYLSQNGLDCEASICYLLSGWSMDGVDSPRSKLALLGVSHSTNPFHYFRNLQAILLSEVYEYLLRLQNSSLVLAHMQSFKLYFALLLTDYGFVDESQKYCESIMTFVKSYSKDTPYFHRQFFVQLKELTGRLAGLTGSASSIEASSWLSKAPIQGLFNAFDRGITKFISGTDAVEASATANSNIKTSPTGNNLTAGHSAAAAAAAVPAVIDTPVSTSMYNYGGGVYQQSQQYPTAATPSGSANGYPYSTDSVYQYQQQNPFQQQYQPSSPPQSTSSTVPNQQQEQGQSQPAYDPYSVYGQYDNTAWNANSRQSSGQSQQQISPQSQSNADGKSLASQQSYSYQNLPSYQNYDPYTSNYASYYSASTTSDSQRQQEPNGNNQSYTANYSSAYAGVYQYDQQIQQQSDAQNTPPLTAENGGVKTEYDDLGFGNSSLSRSKSTLDRPDQSGQDQSSAAATTTSTQDPTGNDESSRTEITESSYMAIIRGFGSLFRRESTRNSSSSSSNNNSGGPIVAKLGEKSKFRYDETLKKWVIESEDGNAPATSAAATPSRPPTGGVGVPSRPPTAPPSTPISQSVNVSRAPSPAPTAPSAYSGSGTDNSAAFNVPDTPTKRASLRKPTRSRYVDPLNPNADPGAIDPAINRSTSASFLPPPTMSAAASGASMPRIMTPAPQKE